MILSADVTSISTQINAKGTRKKAWYSHLKHILSTSIKLYRYIPCMPVIIYQHFVCVQFVQKALKSSQNGTDFGTFKEHTEEKPNSKNKIKSKAYKENPLTGGKLQKVIHFKGYSVQSKVIALTNGIS